jgi:hypothetical protein
MKLECISIIFLLFSTAENVLATDLPTAGETVGSSNRYHVAFVDVKDEKDQADKAGDTTFIRSELYPYLKALDVRSTYSDDADADLHVICRFKHKLMLPVITRGAQIKTTEIGECTLKIVDKKTEKVLIEKSWVRGKKNGELEDFFGSVFAEWKAQREKEAASHAQPGTDAKMTNSVPSASTATNGQAVK